MRLDRSFSFRLRLASAYDSHMSNDATRFGFRWLRTADPIANTRKIITEERLRKVLIGRSTSLSDNPVS